jgi:hypothetical protein
MACTETRVAARAADLLVVERFDYLRLGDQLAAVRLLATLAPGLPTASEPRLDVWRGGERTSHPGIALAWDGLLWRASFGVPLAIVELPDALFQLAVVGWPEIALPVPVLARSKTQVRRGWLPPSPLVRRIATAATVVGAWSLTLPPGGAAAAVLHPHHQHGAVVVAQGHRRQRSGGPDARGWRADSAISTPLPAVPTHRPPFVDLPGRAGRAGGWSDHGAWRHPGRGSDHGVAAPVPGRHRVHRDRPGGRGHSSGGAALLPARHRVVSGRPHPVAPHQASPSGSDERHAASGPVQAPAPIAAPLSPRPSGGALHGAARLSRLSQLLAKGNQPPSFLIPIYKAAGRRFHVPWRVLAAINWIETRYGGDLNVSSAGAIGWMQFMPSTWREWGISADGKGRPDPFDPRDAIFSAARYLAANGARHDLRRAIFAYNHAQWYVDEVLFKAELITDGARLPKHGKVRERIEAMIAMADVLIGKPYIWGGGHGAWQIQPGYDCSGFVSAVLHAGGYLRAPQTTDTLPFNGDIRPGPGDFVTIFDRTGAGANGHVIIELNGVFYESGGSAADGGGAGVKRFQPPLQYLASFNRVLHPAGL